MNVEKTLLDKAQTNLGVAKILLQHPSDDEALLNMMGYHLQQALELALKYELEQEGVEYIKTHDIDQLLRIAKENKVPTKANEYIQDHSEMFTQWESKTRYVLGYLVEKEKIEKALPKVEDYLLALLGNPNTGSETESK